MDGTTYRKLTGAEIAVMEGNGCSAADWSHVKVSEAFTPEEIKRCRFSGTVHIGKNVRIENIHEIIENYEIGDSVTIINTEKLAASDKSTFGNGTKVAVLNESGGREVPVYKGLSAPIAYLTALYRRRPEVVQSIENLIDAEIKSNTPELGQIGTGTYIAHCGALTDICTGQNAILQGVAELTNGTVDSTAESPTTIGRGVIARDFIISDSVEIKDFARLSRCFVGQGSRIGKGFTAQDSLFFANCECEQGEACSVFAGPYTVTHHKSTLLIGGMFSFYNAGSGTNQSNHMYRLGPIHQGILERGCKTGSSSYILFPAHIGVYSIVRGRHYSHPDTAELPFSHLIEENGRSILLPGSTLRSIGLARDLCKWPERDRRKGTKLDPIVFNTLTPYSLEKIVAGLALLKTMETTSAEVSFNGVVLPARQIERGREIYQTTIDRYLAEVVIQRIQAGKNLKTAHKLSAIWSDLSGLIAPETEIERMLEILPSMHSLHELKIALNGLYGHYREWEWDYAAFLLESTTGKPVNDFSNSDWRRIIENGIAAFKKCLQWLTEDTAKEFSLVMRTGYSFHADKEERDTEFDAVQGTIADHHFVGQIQKEFAQKIAEAEEAADKIKNM